MELAYGDGVRHRAGLLGAMRRFWWVVVAVTVVASTSGYLAANARPERYRATARLLLAAPDEASVFRGRAGSGSPERRLSNEVERVESVEVATRAAETLGNRFSPDAVRARINAEAQAERDVIVITGNGASAKEAADVTNAVAAAYRDLRREREQVHATQATASLDQYAKELSDAIAAADARLQQIRQQFDAQVAYLPTPEERLDAVVTRMEADLETQRLLNDRTAAQDQLLQLRTEAKQIITDAALNDAGVNLYETADEPRAPSSPKPRRDAALAGVLGLVAAAAWVWTRAERLQEQVDGHDAAVVLGAPLLAEIPTLAPLGLEVISAPRTGRRPPHGTEPFQLVVASLQFALAQSGAKSVMVTSPGTGDGRTFVAFNLAAAAVRDGRRVVLVDADLRTHHLTTQLGLEASKGLGELVGDDTGAADIPAATVTLKDDHHLTVVPAGSFVYARTVLDDAGLHRALGRLEASADLVVVDAPPVLTVGDASTIAAGVDGTVVVVGRGTEVRTLEEVRWRLVLTGTPVLGCVLNHAPRRHRSLGHRLRPPSPRDSGGPPPLPPLPLPLPPPLGTNPPARPESVVNSGRQAEGKGAVSASAAIGDEPPNRKPGRTWWSKLRSS